MNVKIYKRTETSRDEEHQDKFIAPIRAEYPDAAVFYDDDRDIVLRPTTRKESTAFHAGSFALFADDETDMSIFLGRCKKAGITLVGAEEDFTCKPNTPRKLALVKWLEARKHGAAMRGARKSAETKKANTAAAMKQIAHELASTNTPSKTVLAKVGIRAIGSIKNHFGFPREELQRRYQAEQKRKQRREAYREQCA
jgi:hypothetical protein